MCKLIYVKTARFQKGKKAIFRDVLHIKFFQYYTKNNSLLLFLPIIIK